MYYGLDKSFLIYYYTIYFSLYIYKIQVVLDFVFCNTNSQNSFVPIKNSNHQLSIKLMKQFKVSILTLFISIFSYSQIVVNEEKKEEGKISTTEGFFVNGGQLKINELVCYTFPDLVVAFDKKEHFSGYDEYYATIEIRGAKEKDDNRSLFNPSNDKNEINMTAEAFNDLFKNTPYGYLLIYPSKDANHKLAWKRKDNTSGGKWPIISPLRLQFANSKSRVEGVILRFKLYGKTAKAPKIIYDTNAEGSRTVSHEIPQFDYSQLVELKLDLKNRIKRKFFGSTPTDPIDTGACYE